MKKVIVSAFCLGLAFTSVNAVANTNNSAVVISISNDDRVAVKPEELPEPIKTTLATDAYKGWSAKEAALINNPAAADMSSASKDGSYYEVVLVKDKETKTVKFHKDGTTLN